MIDAMTEVRLDEVGRPKSLANMLEARSTLIAVSSRDHRSAGRRPSTAIGVAISRWLALLP